MIPEEQNFCRIFEIPTVYPPGFCFEGGKTVMFAMVDWFNPMSDLDKEWSDCVNSITAFVKSKKYIRPGRKYLLLTDFGESLVIESDEK